MQITDQGIKFELNEVDSTATIIKIETYLEHFSIPSFINHQSRKYKIISISKKSCKFYLDS